MTKAAPAYSTQDGLIGADVLSSTLSSTPPAFISPNLQTPIGGNVLEWFQLHDASDPSAKVGGAQVTPYSTVPITGTDYVVNNSNIPGGGLTVNVSESGSGSSSSIFLITLPEPLNTDKNEPLPGSQLPIGPPSDYTVAQINISGHGFQDLISGIGGVVDQIVSAIGDALNNLGRWLSGFGGFLNGDVEAGGDAIVHNSVVAALPHETNWSAQGSSMSAGHGVDTFTSTSLHPGFHL